MFYLVVNTNGVSQIALILSRESGTAGHATFTDGSTNKQVQGSTTVAIKGTEMSSGLKNMRLRAVTESGELSPSELVIFRVAPDGFRPNFAWLS